MAIRKTALFSLIFTLAIGTAAYAANSTISYEVSQDHTGDISTSTANLSYEVKDDDGLKKISLIHSGKSLDEISCSGKTSKTGSFYMSNSWLKQNSKAPDPYKITIKAEDMNGEMTEKEASFSVDLKEPKISISGVEDGKVYNKDVNVSVKLEDDYLSSDTAKLTITKDGTSVVSLNNINAIDDYVFTPEEDGEYKISVSLKDSSGNEATENMTFTLDKTPPELSEINLSGQKGEGTDIFISSVEARLDASDSTSGISEGKLFLNDKFVESKTYDSKNTSIVFSMTKDVLDSISSSDGSYTAKIVVSDKAGNLSEKEASFMADTGVPQINITGITDGQITNKAPEVKITASDDISAVSIATVTLDGEEILNEENQEITFTPKENGRYVISAFARDSAGRTSPSSKVSFIYDTTSPVLDEIIIDGQKREGFSYFYADVNAGSGAEDNLSGIKDITVSVNGKTFSKEAFERSIKEDIKKAFTKEWITENASEDGRYDVKIDVTDAAGNTSSKTSSFYADTENPTVSYQGVENGTIANKKPSSKAQAIDNLGAVIDFTVSLDKNRIIHNNRSSVSSFSPVKNGTYIVTMKAVDRAGNESPVRNITYRYDTVLPNIGHVGITGLKTHGFEWFKNSVTIKSILSDAFTGLKSVEMTVNDESVFSANLSAVKRFALTKTLTRDWIRSHESDNGLYVVRIKISDMAGNERTITRTFKADTRRPSISLSGIANGTHARYTPTYTARVSDNYSGRNVVTYKIYRDGKLISTIRRTGRISSIHLFHADGDYVITAQAQDLAGNLSPVVRKHFTKDTIAPSISLTGAGGGNYYNTSRAITAHIKERNYKFVTVTNTGSKVLDGKRSGASLGKITPTRRDYSKATRLHANGTYSLTLSAVDKAGNRARPVTITFTIDTVKPKVTLNGVNAENGYDSVVAPKITYSDSYYSSRNISLTKTGKKPEGIYFRDSKTAKGGSRVYSDFTKAKLNDGVYNIVCSVKDKAGNVTTVHKIFKVNRYGSTFSVSKKSKKFRDKYLKEMTESISIVEKNVTGLKKKEVVITRDGQKIPSPVVKIKETDLPTGEKAYRYEIAAANFKEEGAYQINTSSEDSLGNYSELTKDFKTFRFFVDKTPPVISVSGIEEGAKYPDGTDLLTVNVSDTIALSGFKVFCDSDQLYSTEDTDDPLRVATISVPDGANHVISVSAVDKAGNTSSYEVKDVTVSNSFMTRHPKAIPVFGGIGLAAAIAAGIVIFLKRRNAKEN